MLLQINLLDESGQSVVRHVGLFVSPADVSDVQAATEAGIAKYLRPAIQQLFASENHERQVAALKAVAA